MILSCNSTQSFTTGWILGHNWNCVLQTGYQAASCLWAGICQLSETVANRPALSVWLSSWSTACQLCVSSTFYVFCPCSWKACRILFPWEYQIAQVPQLKLSMWQWLATRIAATAGAWDDGPWPSVLIMNGWTCVCATSLPFLLQRLLGYHIRTTWYPPGSAPKGVVQWMCHWL